MYIIPKYKYLFIALFLGCFSPSNLNGSKEVQDIIFRLNFPIKPTMIRLDYTKEQFNSYQLVYNKKYKKLLKDYLNKVNKDNLKLYITEMELILQVIPMML